MSAAEEVLVPPPGQIAPLSQVRGVLITASLRALDKRGLLDRYYAALAPEHHDAVRSIIASSWVPEAVGTGHYRACDALGLAQPEIMAIGAEVGNRMRDTFLGSLIAAAREAGTTPWFYLERMPRLFARVCIGGGCAVYKLGPKEARAEWYGLPGLALPYFRTAFRGAHQSIIELVCTKAYVSETKAVRGGDWGFKASWV